MFLFARKFVDKLEGHVPSRTEDTYFRGVSHINNNGFALRVLHVQPHSAAQTAGLESWFDYIVKINNRELPMKYPASLSGSYGINEDGTISYGGRSDDRSGEIDYDSLTQELATIAKSAHNTVSLDVWNAKGGVLRQVSVQLDQYTYAPQKLPLSVSEIFHDKFKQIGATLQLQHINTATFVWRVLNTHPNLPAFQAQLVPFSDYVIGCDSAFSSDENGKGLLARGGEALFSKTVLSYYDHHHARLGEDSVPITLYVYNHDYDTLRPVTVHLLRSWAAEGNRGILGCDVGYGLLHRLPEVIGKFDTKIEKLDDVLFEDKSDYSYKFNENQNHMYIPQPKQESAQNPQVLVVATPPPKVTPNPIGMVPFNPEDTELPAPPLPPVSTRTPAPSVPPSALVSAPPSVASPYAPTSSVRSAAVAPPQSPILPPIGAKLSLPAVATQGVPPSIAPPKLHRKKKQHASNGISSLTDFMNEELTKSKNSDVQYGTSGSSETPPPPPPPRSARQ